MRRGFLFIMSFIAALVFVRCGNDNKGPAVASNNQESGFLEELKLVDYRPVSVFKTTHIEKASFPVIDMHSHAYLETAEGVEAWVKLLDENNIEKVIVLTNATGEEFDRIYDLYKSVAPERFELWCSFDMTSLGTDEYPQKAIAELERCHKKGASGVGEILDKGGGEINSAKIQSGIHIDDDIFVPLLSKCADLGMPVNMHVADPIWMYMPIDEHNDGYPNAVEWKIDTTKQGILGFDGMIKTMTKACKKNPRTVFIACHLMNLSHDYKTLGEALDENPNLMIDISARFQETAITPRATADFYTKYSERIFFGTDNFPIDAMYDVHWRILESDDEHFYYEYPTYHWALYGLDLDKKILKNIYRDNALKLYSRLDKSRLNN